MNWIPHKQPKIAPVTMDKVPEPLCARLKNGIPVFLFEAATEDVMRIDFSFNAGQIKEEFPLLSSAVNMMLTEKTANYSATKLKKILDYHGAFYNLYAEKDLAGIVLFFMNRHTEKMLELAREILFLPVFNVSEFGALMNKRLRWFLVSHEKVNNLAMDQFYESIFGKDHPYGRQVIQNDFKKLDRELLLNFHSNFYKPERMSVFVSGKIQKNTLDLLNKYFGEIVPDNNQCNDSFPVICPSTNKNVHIEKKGAIQTAIRIGSPSINKLHPDYLGLKVVDAVLGGYFNSRLMKNIREEKGLTYGIHSIITSLRMSGFKVISTEVSKKSTQYAIDEIYREMKILQEIPVEKHELEVVRNYMLGELVRMFDGPFAIAESFKSVWEYGLDNSYYLRLAGKIKTIEPDEIIALSRTYYNTDDMYQVTAG